MGLVDLIVFVVLAVVVIGIGIWQSRGEETKSEHGASDYFLAGRGLTWWLVGFSLIAANISTEQFVGMSGQAADWLGMAIASYEWMAAITLVVVAFLFLPTFLKSGIYTIPEFLEYRYDKFARTVMALFSLIVLVGVPTVTVIFSGAKVVTANFQGVYLGPLHFGDIPVACWIIGIVAAGYVFAGGLKSCAWTDLMWGSGLILGGFVILYYTFQVLTNADPQELVKTAANSSVTAADLESAGAWSRFWQLNSGPLPDGKLHMFRPKDDTDIPWTALMVGLWIPNFFYWGLNQYITQRTLGSKSLAEGQRGIVFAAFLKLIIPFVVVIPGILAFNLFNADLREDAVNHNAAVIAEKSPELYATLSDALKPINSDRHEQEYERIQEIVSEGANPVPCVYIYDERFAGLYPEDVVAINEHSYDVLSQAVQIDRPPVSSDPVELVTYSGKLSEAHGSLADSGIDLEKLKSYDTDNAFPTLIRELLPANFGIKGFVLVAIFGAVVSSLASMLNSASTIATMDLYRKVRGPKTSQGELVSFGRVCVIVFMLIAAYLAPALRDPQFGGIFKFIQEFQGFISPGILAIFLFGVLVHRAPRYAGMVGLILNPILYGAFKWTLGPWMCKNGLWWADEISFLDRMALCFVIIIIVLTFLTLVNPLKKPVDLPVNEKMNLTQSSLAKVLGVMVCVLTVVLYIVFF
jgi:SSS family solute:Na+ symporter